MTQLLQRVRPNLMEGVLLAPDKFICRMVTILMKLMMELSTFSKF